MPRQLRVFLCHASQDKPAVRELYQRLKAEDWVDPWLDEEKLSFGQHWTTAIEEALFEADVVIIFLSKNSVQKEGFVQRELNYAWELSLEKPRNVIFLIPFRLDDCQIPRYLGSRQWGDYFGDKKENTYQILLRSLKQRHQQKLKLEAEEEAERERAGREIAEKVVLEKQEEARKKAELEFIEKAKLKEKKTEWEATERIAREQAEREKIELAQVKQTNTTNERAVRERAELEQAAERERETSDAFERLDKAMQSLEKEDRRNTILRWIGFSGSILLLALSVWNYLLNNASITVTESPVTAVANEMNEPTPSPTKTFIPALPTPRIGSTMTSEKDDMTLVFVPAGEFIMGSYTRNYSDERPDHQVFLDAFWVDQTEVTNTMYSKCVADGGCTPPSSPNSHTYNKYYGSSTYDDYPVINVNWNQATAYCSWAERRLPTEAEWEKAARGTDERTYPWGSDFPNSNLLNYNSNVGDTTEVRKYPGGGSIYGALDMAGNVWEWVNDWYDENYYATFPSSNPQGPTSGAYRVLRGGSWDDGDNSVRSAFRNRNISTSSSVNLGFRCSLSQP